MTRGALTAYERVIDALRDTVPSVRVNGKQATANCPAHDDTHPSLGVTPIEGSVLIRCRSQNCHIDDILTAIGLTTSDLYDEPKGATYRYDDGRIVHRTPDKKFRQTGVTSTENGTQLYRLDKVAAAVRDKIPVYWVEGEKDVHALESLGAVATTAPMGATNVGKVDATPLTGARVIAVPDQDTAGIKWQEIVLQKLVAVGATVKIGTIREGKDAADHIAAGHSLDEITLSDPRSVIGPPADPEAGPLRVLRLTPASAIKPRPVRWAWDDRIPTGTLTLIPGRVGIGKSLLLVWTAARLTRGELPGVHHGTPKPVIMLATEDSWEHTIVPRLIVAGADLNLVYRAEIIVAEMAYGRLTLPRDCALLTAEIQRLGAALVGADPLISLIDGKVDTHKNRDVREALEPLVKVAAQTNCSIVGLAHHNKSAGADPLGLITGSAAFSEVVRAVISVARDPDTDDGSVIVTQTKNNLGRLDLTSLRYVIDSVIVDTEEGPAPTGRLCWTGDSERTVFDILEAGAERDDGALGDACEWLRDFLEAEGAARVSDVRKHARSNGHSDRTLDRAKRKLRVVNKKSGFGANGHWEWSLPPKNPKNATKTTSQNVGALRDVSDVRTRRVTDGEEQLSTPTLPLSTPLSTPTPHTQNSRSETYSSKNANSQGPPARAREKPPVCDDCGESVDSIFHANTCETP